jgi:hypothetical protein
MFADDLKLCNLSTNQYARKELWIMMGITLQIYCDQYGNLNHLNGPVHLQWLL